MILHLLLSQLSRVLHGLLPFFVRPSSFRVVHIIILPLLIPFSIFSSLLSSLALTHKEALRWASQGKRKQQMGDAIGRALNHALQLVTDLPTSSPKYNFAQTMAEEILANNAAQKTPLLHVNRAALARAFVRTINHLEAALRRERGSTRIGQLIEKYNSWTTLMEVTATEGDRAEKLSRELQWLVDRLSDCGGIEDAILHYSRGATLAAASLSAGPRVQSNLVKLTALLCRSIGQDFCLVPFEAQFRLLLIWMPLLCRATHSGDGPIFTAREKQETEDAIQRIVSSLHPERQEMIFSEWLQEYSWSSSDWPNLSNAYTGWCDHVRRQTSMMK